MYAMYVLNNANFLYFFILIGVTAGMMSQIYLYNLYLIKIQLFSTCVLFEIPET